MKWQLGIRGAHLLSMKGGSTEVTRDQFIGVRDGRIETVQRWTPDLSKSCEEFIEGNHHVLMPGLINGHTHLAMTLFRGLRDDESFQNWLFHCILPLEAKLVNADFVKTGTELAALECIRFGVTTVADMYFFASMVGEVLDRAGLRGWIGQVWSNAELPEDRVLGRDKAKLFFELKERYGGHSRIIPTLAPHAPYTCDDGIFRQVGELSEKYNAPIHTHVAETKREVEESLAEHKKTPVRRLFDLGVLTAKTLCAHGVHVNEEDMALLRKAGAAVVYNPDSNLKLAAGIAPIVSYKRIGIPVAFGTDGAASNNDLNVFAAMDIGVKLQKWSAVDSTAMVAEDALRSATWEGARALGLQDQIGSIEKGKLADIILIDLDSPNLKPLHDIRSHLVYAMCGTEVSTVICHGRILMRDRAMQTLDQERIFALADAWQEKIASSGGSK